LTGTGIVPVTLSATSLGFGVVLVGNSSNAPAVTLTNQMASALTGITVAITGTGYTQTNTCGTSIAAGAQCKIFVTFTPTVVGAQTGSVTITDSAANSPQTITLTATGQLPVNFNPASLAFGTVTVKTTTAAKTVTMANNAKTALTISSITLSGADPGDFAQTTNTCGTTLAAAGKCTFSYTFTPAKAGPRTATITVTDSAKSSPQTIRMTGTGQAAAVALETTK
jgi:hypothetical protein